MLSPCLLWYESVCGDKIGNMYASGSAKGSVVLASSPFLMMVLYGCHISWKMPNPWPIVHIFYLNWHVFCFPGGGSENHHWNWQLNILFLMVSWWLAQWLSLCLSLTGCLTFHDPLMTNVGISAPLKLNGEDLHHCWWKVVSDDGGALDQGQGAGR